MVVRVDGHGRHISEPGADAVVPSSQGRHGSSEFGLNQPTEHGTQVSPSASVPGPHGIQRIRSASENLPFLQAAHSAAPGSETDPSGQPLQDGCPSVELLPASHVSQLARPSAGASLPAGQSEHSASALDDDFPTGHSVHSDAGPDEDLPATQSVQVGSPSVGASLPAGHSVHSEAAPEEDLPATQFSQLAPSDEEEVPATQPAQKTELLFAI